MRPGFVMGSYAQFSTQLPRSLGPDTNQVEKNAQEGGGS